MIAWMLGLALTGLPGGQPSDAEAKALDGGPWSGRVLRRPFVVALATGWPEAFTLGLDQSWRWIALGAEIGAVLRWDPRWRDVIPGVRTRGHARLRVVHRARGGLAVLLATGVRQWVPPRPRSAAMTWDHEVGVLGSIRVREGDMPVHLNLGATVPLQYPAGTSARFWYAVLLRVGVEVVPRPAVHVQVHGFVGPRLRRPEHFEPSGVVRDVWWGLRVGVAFALPRRAPDSL